MARLNDDLTYGYFPIVKMDKTPDGLMVYGRAAGPGLDLDGQGFSAEYLKTAVPDWFKWANVREQHQQIASGVGKELIDNGDGSFMVKALVVDPVTIKKVETGVLKGFSPGIRGGRIRKSAKYPNGEIYAGQMIELSLVDRPSDPSNAITICKSAGGPLFLPTDADGNELSFEGGTPIMYLTEDLHKAATATVLAVLGGEYDDADAEDTAAAVHELSDLLIAEGFMLKSADLAGGQYDATNLVNCLAALEVLTEVDDYPGDLANDVADLRKSANIDNNTIEDLVKAATADLTKAYDAKVEALLRTVEELRATPVGGGAPVVLPPQHALKQINKSAGTGIDYAKSASLTSDPAYAAILHQLAEKEAKTS